MFDKLRPYVEEKLISEQKHPEADLWIYNYTKRCQYDSKWDEITMMCRGLIINKDGKIEARPFRKFFNLGERKEELPAEPFRVYEKYDGSLGILYWINDEIRLATRGSFTSPQAIKGSKMLQKYKSYPFRKDLTYLFEIIYPDNKIVVDYGEEKLVLLSVRETETGKELPLEQFNGFEIAKRYDWDKDLKTLVEKQEDNREGFVIFFQSGLRLKIKFDEYIRLHRIVTETNSKRIWEHLKDNLPIEELIDRVPDEFYAWVKKTIADLKGQYIEIEDRAKAEFEGLKHLERKEFAKEAIKSIDKAVLFKLLDGQDYSEVIWKRIKPIAEKPYKVIE